MKRGRACRLSVLISGPLIAFLLQGCLHAELASMPGKAPSITNSHGIEKARFGDVLNLYLEADDPDNDMLRVAAVVDQAGYGRYSVEWIYLKPEYSGRLTGYLQWNTSSSKTDWLAEWTQMMIQISVFDKAGNESNVARFPVTFVSEVVPNPPPPSPFDRPNIPKLGNIFINLIEPTMPPNP